MGDNRESCGNNLSTLCLRMQGFIQKQNVWLGPGGGGGGGGGRGERLNGYICSVLLLHVCLLLLLLLFWGGHVQLAFTILEFLGGGGGGGGEIRPWDIHWDQSGPTALSSEIAALLLPL